MLRPSFVAAAIALPVLGWGLVAAFVGGPQDEWEAAFAATASQEGRTDAYLDAHYRFDAAVRDTVLAALTPERLDAFAYPWRALDACTYERRRRTEQRTRDDLLLNAVETHARHDGQAAHVLRQDSAAAFDFGYFSRYVSLNADSYDPLHVEAVVLKDLAALLSPAEERYVFRADRDTFAAGVPVRVLELEARPGVGDGLNVRRVRAFYDRARARLVGLDVWRIDLGDLHREEARVEAMLAPDGHGRLLPGTTRFATTGKVPFRQPMRFETAAVYGGFACPER